MGRPKLGSATIEKDLKEFEAFDLTAYVVPEASKITKNGDLVLGLKVPKQYQEQWIKAVGAMGVPLTVHFDRWRNKDI